MYPDGLGRTVKVETGSGTTVDSIVETEYDSCACSPLGKVKRVSQPYRPGQTPVYTVYGYDALGRTVSVTHPPVSGTTGNSGVTTYVYSTNSLVVTDPAGAYKRYYRDAFGNLIWVVDQRPGGGEYGTGYSYNLLNRLTYVDMGRDGVGQVRTFEYNAQQRLWRVTHPESGMTTYEYNTDGTLLRRTDAKNQKVEYSYDAIKRVTQIRRYKAGVATPDVCNTVNLAYDTVVMTGQDGTSYGQTRLTQAQWGSSNTAVCGAGLLTEQIAYSRAGLVTGKRLLVSRNGGPTQGVLSGQLGMYYIYDAEGRLVDEYYPNTGGPKFSTGYDLNGRPQLKLRWEIGQPNASIAKDAEYNAAGQMTSLNVLGTVETRQYNGLNQMTRQTVPGAMDTEYVYKSAGNDGRVWKQKDWMSGEEVEYVYDSMKRLTSAVTAANPSVPQWGQGYVYDGFGKLTGQTPIKGSTAFSLNVNGANNRVMTWGYDGNGNVVNDGTRTYSYDVENRLEANELGQQYGYGPDNRRV
jgi:YD repeat-containing protein